MKNKIGIVGWSTGENSFGAGKAYMEYFSQFGDVIILPPTYTIFEDLSLLVLPGGTDTLASNYGEAPSFYNSNPDMMKEFFYLNCLNKYVKLGTPIFGVCLGLQMLNVHFGGGLTQHVWHPESEKSRSELVHPCQFTTEFSSLRKLSSGEFKVNSMHHQGVALEQIADCLKVVAYHENVVEALIHETLNIAAVQWHAEEIYDRVSTFLIQKLLDNVTARNTKKDTSTVEA